MNEDDMTPKVPEAEAGISQDPADRQPEQDGGDDRLRIRPEFAFVFDASESFAAQPNSNSEPEGATDPLAAERFIVLLRHGIAEDPSEDKPDDERSLTKKGAQRMKEIGRGLAEILPDLETIFTSTLVRALQTGVFLAKGHGGKPLVQMTEALEPGRGPAAFRALLATTAAKHVLFIGHEPDLTGILGDLCNLDPGSLGLKKGGCYGVRILASGAGRLEWMLPPGVLRRIRE